MLYEVMQYCRNYFPVGYIEGTFTIKDGSIALPDSFSTRFILIEGSTCNDGVWETNTCILEDEEFTGVVTALAPPKAFLMLVKEIQEWKDKYKDVIESPYQSESFGGYSYVKSSGASGSSQNASATSWQKQFANSLYIWRKI